MILTSFLTTPMFIALSSAKPLERVSPLRPPHSFFHRSVFLSVLGQAALNVGCLAFAVHAAKNHSPPMVSSAAHGVGFARRKFVPNLVTNAVFLLSTVQTVMVCLVNHKGYPFMKGVLETKGILYPAAMTLFLCAVILMETFPGINVLFQMAPFPSLKSRALVGMSMIVSVLGTLGLDYFVVKTFDPDLHKARASRGMSDEAKANLRLLVPVLGVTLWQMANLENSAAELCKYFDKMPGL
ncbi:unnamed protein product [Choristocarpus tenellus]